ncbi:hypothetical protein A8950_2160 [Dongia mobilis]|uniref:Uncharacterized protein n=1 Tax=Dongia mobilis TaxID=578943 RepID=A0A4R6WRZ2_9PROT|nr:hypothetical protein [Dongia mobilis]TDQ82337.1 hypothetical protein A8950_2160 [Dongia mobilis]
MRTRRNQVETGTGCAGRANPTRRGLQFGIAFLAATLAGCAAPQAATTPGAAPLVISQSTAEALQEYLGKLDPMRRGAFAVSVDGRNSYGVYCPEISCQINVFGGTALSQCRSLSGQECRLLYVAMEPRIAFTVATAKGPAGKHGLKRARPLDELPAFRE